MLCVLAVSSAPSIPSAETETAPADTIEKLESTLGQKMVSDLQELELQAVVSQQLKDHFSYTVSSRLISDYI